MIKCKFYTMNHKGGLYESLETRKEISIDKFCDLINLYEYYCYDERINCYRFILRNAENLNYTMWLLLERI